jgi:hypothetical protein
MTQSLLLHGGIRTLPEARVQGESVSTWMLSLARARPYCSSDSLRRGLEPKCNRVPFEISYQLI